MVKIKLEVDELKNGDVKVSLLNNREIIETSTHSNINFVVSDYFNRDRYWSYVKWLGMLNDDIELELRYNAQPDVIFNDWIKENKVILLKDVNKYKRKIYDEVIDDIKKIMGYNKYSLDDIFKIESVLKDEDISKKIINLIN